MIIVTMNFIKLTNVPIANPTVIPIKTIVVIIGKASAITTLGTALKSNGNIDSKVKTVAMPNKFKIISVVSRSMYLSKKSKIIWPTMERVNVIVRIGNHAL